MFETVPESPEDALHAVMGRYNADPRNDKIDLGVGVYREANGNSPIMQCVTKAQQQWQREESSKSYLALRGDARFLAAMTALVFGADAAQELCAIQSVGGTGGVRLGLELAREAKPDLTVFVGAPTWPNHLGICNALNLRCQTWPYLNHSGKELVQFADAERAFECLETAQAGDVIVLHGPCHNPTGADLEDEALLALVERAGQMGVIPLIDAAYYGLGGVLEEDLALLKACTERAPESLLVMSCSKAFGLYRERTGVLFASCKSPKAASRVLRRLEFMARGNYSMPPSHGAAIAGIVLNDPTLKHLWRSELALMRERITILRHELQAASIKVPALNSVGRQQGIFSMLPLSPQQVTKLAERHAIYLPASGRINVAGLKANDVDRFVDALSQV